MPLFFIYILLLFPASALAKIDVGQVNYVRGVLTSELENDDLRILAKNDRLYLGDYLSTGASGFSVIELKDGTKIALRPNTQFSLENLVFKRKKANALLRLFSGGLRIVTGYISKNNEPKNNFQVYTPVATIGVRGTKFDVRICDNDCDNTSKPKTKVEQVSSKVIGRIAQLKGSITATNEIGKTRHLQLASSIYPHDQLLTKDNSYAVIVFNDESRITITADSMVEIVSHNFNIKKPKQNHAALRLIRGGLRILSGLISKLNREQYTVSALTATFGMRGTGFDLFCDGNCKKNAALSTAAPQECSFQNTHTVLDMFKTGSNTPKEGLLMRVWDGTIEINVDDCQLLLNEGEVAVLKEGKAPPLRIYDSKTIKPELDNTPRPDQVEIPDSLLKSKDASTTEEQTPKNGLYVHVRDGDVQVKAKGDNKIDLGIGESGYVSQEGTLNRLSKVPSFLSNDAVPAPADFNANSASLINLVGENQISSNEFQCFIR